MEMNTTTGKMEAGTKEIKEFFGLTGTQMIEQWKKLSMDERQYFKEAVGDFLNNLGK